MRYKIAFKNHQRGREVAAYLLDEGYVVMMSYEEELLIVDYIWSANNADRNAVVFMGRDEYNTEVDNIIATAIRNRQN